MQLTLKERKRFSLTCLLTVYNLFIHSVCILDQRLEGLDHLQEKHPDRRSHGQLDAGGSLLGPGPPPAWPSERSHTAPTWHPTQAHGETDQVTPPYTSAQTRLWGMCPKVLTLDVTLEPAPNWVPFSMKRDGHGCTSDPSFMLKPHHLIESCSTQMPHSIHPRCLRLRSSLKLPMRIKNNIYVMHQECYHPNQCLQRAHEWF